MAQTSDTGARKFSIKVEGKELDRIIQSRKNLDDVKALVPHINQYKNLGWSPVALELPEGNDLGVDFHQPETKILWALMDLALREISVGLAVRLDAGSPLFVMRVNRDLGVISGPPRGLALPLRGQAGGCLGASLPGAARRLALAGARRRE